MRLTIYLLLAVITGLVMVQCDRNTQMGNHQMNDEQMGQMMQNPQNRQAMMGRLMQNPEARRAMMGQMAENPEMRQEMMGQMRSSMMNMDQDEILDRMEQMFSNPERRQQIAAQMKQIQEMLESGEFDREQMREMMGQSPMMGIQMRCMQMMQEPDSNQEQD